MVNYQQRICKAIIKNGDTEENKKRDILIGKQKAEEFVNKYKNYIVESLLKACANKMEKGTFKAPFEIWAGPIYLEDPILFNTYVHEEFTTEAGKLLDYELRVALSLDHDYVFITPIVTFSKWGIIKKKARIDILGYVTVNYKTLAQHEETVNIVIS